MIRQPLHLILILSLGSGTVSSADTSIQNPTDRSYRQALFRLAVEMPVGSCRVQSGGADVPCQVESTEAGRWLWVCRDVPPKSTVPFTVTDDKPAQTSPLVKVVREDDGWLLDNGLLAVRVPVQTTAAERGPILGLRLPDGRWVGRSVWKTASPAKLVRADLVGDGTLFAKVCLRYEFGPVPGMDGPGFAEFDIALGPGWRHLDILERHRLRSGDAWEFEVAQGWRPTEGRSRPFSGGPGSGAVSGLSPADRPLLPGGLPFQRPELFIDLLPRWNQHYKDGWFFAATDGQQAVGVMPVLAGQWIWPHDNVLEVLVQADGTTATVRCPMRHGQRRWWLMAGTADSPAGRADLGYFHEYGFENLDKINRDFILGWPGKSGGWFHLDPYDGGQINPTGRMRNWRRMLLPKVGQTGDLGTWYQAQVFLHPDSYGSLWDFWSSENPNFFTDYIHVPVLLATMVKEHPRFEALRGLVEMRVHEDIHHAFTLPGGAGQECPGYMAGAWVDREGICRKHLGFDPTTWPQMAARRHFLERISQPDGERRRTLPMGDTHPKAGGPAAIEVPTATVAGFVTEELPGFGVIFNHRPGTPRETYLAFKAGPNRGHYHGDQLSVVLNCAARPVVVDHHCSYRPRAGQEHMHNRLAFFTADQPYLNLDGYERLIGFATSAVADVAIGQVESDRLRACTAQPDEVWDQRWPLVPLERPLIYRRTVVFVKGQAGDAVVLRDQYRSPIGLGAAYCLHVRDDQALVFQNQFTDKGGTTDGTTVFTDPGQDYLRWKVHPGWRLVVSTLVPGSRKFVPVEYEVKAVQGSTGLLLDRAAPAGEHQQYTLCAARGVDTDGGVEVSDPDQDFAAWPVQAGWVLVLCDRKGGHVSTRAARYAVTALQGSTLVLDRPAPAATDQIYRLYAPRIRREGNAIECGNLKLTCITPQEFSIRPFPWRHDNGVPETTQGLRLETRGSQGEFITVLSDGTIGPAEAIRDGVRVGGVEVVFAGDLDSVGEVPLVTVRQEGNAVVSLTGKQVDLDRFQGAIGLFIPDAGYPFGELPDWLIRQREKPPEWYVDFLRTRPRP